MSVKHIGNALKGRKIKRRILVTCKIRRFCFFCPSVSSCLCSFGLRCFDKFSDRRKSIQSSGHKKDIPFLKILVTCKISKRGCPSYTYKYVFLLSIEIRLYFSVSPRARRRAPGSGWAPRKERYRVIGSSLPPFSRKVWRNFRATSGL